MNEISLNIAGDRLNGDNLLADLGERSADISLQCSDTAGFISRVNERIQADLALLSELQARMTALTSNQQESDVAARELQTTAMKAEKSIDQANQVAALSLDAFSRLIAHVVGLDDQLRGFLDIIGSVGTISEELSGIAQQTRMLGVNAAIEAARGGEATKGFAVVAEEIRRLAGKAADSSASVGDKLVDLDRHARTLIGGIETNIAQGRETERHIDDLRTTMTAISAMVTQFRDRSEEISMCAREAASDVGDLRHGLGRFSTSAVTSAGELDDARVRMDDLESSANDMLNRVAHGGVKTRNSRFIALAEDGVEAITACIEQALSAGTLTKAALFDTDYQPIAGTDPIQYRTGLVDFADAQLRPILDAFTARDPAIVGCCLVDMNGFLPTHITPRSQPQRPGMREWNLANSRNQQIFMDNQTRRALDGDEEFFLFSYRQYMGEGNYRPLRSVLVPLEFDGRRWGLYEVGYLI